MFFWFVFAFQSLTLGQTLLKAGGSYEDYVNMTNPKEAMSRDRWIFVSKNYTADATEDIAHFDSPILLMVGDHDINVDVRETEQV
ncbi:hypothetical protein MH215_17070 [Paenibacillus sp. ACRSA]|uniref:hypothetical protein n=1 Tax=Paenibacillus sp. ACRSA TaxID=2918211 RepID=UPI001EF58F5B|nr:hypothetical protein [Paenibacillus sp. ACRSA]MCG7378722.1 hypothetical protein [Paenibacillus sp. ACRSA]